MTALALCTIVLVSVGGTPGDTSGWGTGEVAFRAYARTNEHHEIYPVCAGQYTVEVAIEEVLDDPAGVLEDITKVDLCYNDRLDLTWGDTVEVKGTYHYGACPFAFCGRVEVLWIERVDWEEPEPPDNPDDIEDPSVTTDSADVTETTVTMVATLRDDGGEPCRGRFFYKTLDGLWWATPWIEYLTTGSTFSQKVAALAPGTRYYYYAYAENSAGTSLGRQGSFTTLVETVPPLPHPAVWAAGPAQTGATGIAMIADIQRDVSGPEEYAFDFVDSPTGGAGGSDSIWQLSPMYLDVGLNPNHQYGYRVKARDRHGNETAYSTIRYEYTDIETPQGIAFGTMTTTSIQARSSSVLSGLTYGRSGLKLENVTAGHVSAWQQDNGFWTDTGLQPNTRYGFRAQARNGDGDPTAFSTEAYIHTLANAPGAGAFTGITFTSIQVQWAANGNPAGTLYLCENTTSGVNSGWIPDTVWNNIGLAPNTSYAYRVRARNGDGVETAWTTVGTQSTDYRSLTIGSNAGGKVASPGQGTFRFAPGASVALAATPLSGYHFLCWTGSAVDAGRVADAYAAQTTVLADAHYTLTANFLRTRIYVDKQALGTGDGSSWRNAFVSLQDALDMAQSGNEVRIAQGIYKPDVGRNVLLGDRLAAFELKSGVALKGGYAGLAHLDPNTRDIAAYETVLTGDLAGDDRAVSESYDLYSDISRTDNSFHVVVAYDAAGTTLLEGVTITAGNGIDGAGICLIRSHPTIALCTIRANRAGQLSGDGLEGWGEGAAASCYQSSPTFSGCTFHKNWAGGLGGAVFSLESDPTVTDCTFQDNEAGILGGGMYCEDSNAVWVNCTFHANWSGDGAAICTTEASDARLTACRFLGNGGRGSGGAVFHAGQSLKITNSIFSGNLALLDGGAVALSQGTAVLTNCTFSHNVAEGRWAGQALAVQGAAASLANCILWGQVDIAQEPVALVSAVGNGTELTVSYSAVLGGESGVQRVGNAAVTYGSGNMDADPQFRNAEGTDRVAGTADDDLHLRPGSPCIDAGNNTAVPADADDLNHNGNRLERMPFDLDGLPRFVDRPDRPDTGLADVPLYPDVVDLGAYELGAASTP